MPEKIYMILHDTAKKGREIFIGQDTKPQHKYADSGVDKLVKLTVIPGGWGKTWAGGPRGKFNYAVEVKDQIWVALSDTLDMLDRVWYPLRPLDWELWQADYERNEAINAEIRRRFGEGS